MNPTCKSATADHKLKAQVLKLIEPKDLIAKISLLHLELVKLHNCTKPRPKQESNQFRIWMYEYKPTRRDQD